jgi:hypothetical protein
MDILYQVNDHVKYFVYPKGKGIVVKGRIIGLGETGHKTDAYRVKRDTTTLQDNVGMYTIDFISPMNILGTVEVPTDE